MNSLFQPRFTITNRMTAAITQIERARGFLEAAKLSEDWIREMGKRALILEAHHTTHYRGNPADAGSSRTALERRDRTGSRPGRRARVAQLSFRL
jgi:hypothetical protein